MKRSHPVCGSFAKRSSQLTKFFTRGRTRLLSQQRCCGHPVYLAEPQELAVSLSKMKRFMACANAKVVALLATLLCIASTAGAQKERAATEIFSLSKEPVNEAWITLHLRKTGPRIILTAGSLATIKDAVKNDDAAGAYYNYLYRTAVALLRVRVLERRLEGRRLLTVSREAVKRIGTLAIVYAVSGERRFLERVNNELIAVCRFSDWNPSHFLDVAEMSYGVAVGFDWTLGDLPDSTRRLVKTSLIEKALKPGLEPQYSGWAGNTNNWNQVCHGGLSVAAIAVADEQPALAAQIISRALENMPKALKSYAPDGAYPEGASYWSYGTSYTLLTLSAFQSAFDTDFGMPDSPGFLQSALFVKMLASPSGPYFNYFDSGSGGAASVETGELLSWFAGKTGNGTYFDKNKFMATANASPVTSLSKLNGAALTWIVKAKTSNAQPLPLAWKGDGENPVVIFRSAPGDSSKFFLGAKGGAARLSHGDMDAGSFVFDLNGVRWSVDLGMPNYTNLEAVLGVNGLWDMKQSSKRWTLMGKNNFGHSTLTVNDSLHLAAGFAPLTRFDLSAKSPTAQFDLSKIFGENVKSAKRTFTKFSNQRLRVEDDVEFSGKTKTITWAMMTQAEVERLDGGVLLKQGGKTVKVTVVQPKGFTVEAISKNPPPLPYDMVVPALKRLEFRWNRDALRGSNAHIIVELSAVE